MPYLKLSTNVNVGSEQSAQLLADFSRLLARETGKPERYVMVELAGDKAMLFGGNADPLAYAECKSIGLYRVQQLSRRILGLERLDLRLIKTE